MIRFCHLPPPPPPNTSSFSFQVILLLFFFFLQPPIVPKVSHEGDTSNFEAYPEDDWKKEAPVSANDLELFKNFWKRGGGGGGAKFSSIAATRPFLYRLTSVSPLACRTFTDKTENDWPSGLPSPSSSRSSVDRRKCYFYFCFSEPSFLMQKLHQKQRRLSQEHSRSQ